MDTKFRIIFGFLLFCNTLLILFLTNYSLQTRSDITGLREELATKEDLLNLTHAKQADVLGQNCTHCHSESKFAGFHGTETEMMAMIDRMVARTGSKIDARDVDAIHASLELLQCNTCHEEHRTRKLALKSPGEQKEVIREMLVRAGSKADQEDVDRLHKSYQQMLGF